ncbi:energy-coupling factor ABC transporter substrate-binding protein [Oscillospiraceae bacterium CM]|nr:energy-coupling factor ABC transporter substrate-binding protein [Oscillospiraceae bacterium CM]
MKLWQKNIFLIILVVIIAAIPLVFIRGEYGGSDDQAQSVIAEIDKDYKPWAHALFEPPSGEIASLLFALQASIGAGIIGFGFGRLSAKYKAGDKN